MNNEFWDNLKPEVVAEINENIKISLEQFERGECVEANDEFWDNMKDRVKNRISNYNKNEK
jgi:hypothetical protein